MSLNLHMKYRDPEGDEFDVFDAHLRQTPTSLFVDQQEVLKDPAKTLAVYCEWVRDGATDVESREYAEQHIAELTEICAKYPHKFYWW